MRQKTAVIFGGTGFIGKILVRALAKQDYTVIVASRYPASAYDLKPCGRVGQIVPLACDYSEDSISHLITDEADLVINLVGVLFEKKTGDFGFAHTEIPWRIAKACKAKKVKNFVHVSALGIDENLSKYAATKREGEKAIKEEYPNVSILRPSIVFGPNDGFFNKFASLSIIMPFLPLIGGGKTRFQPVYVGDVVDMIIKAGTDTGLRGKVTECVGPDILTFKELFEKMFDVTKRRRLLLPLPWAIAKFQAMILGLMPNPLLTTDQVKSLKTDNIATGAHKTQFNYGVEKTSLDQILPQYLCKYQRGGMFGKTRGE
jgi:uncharacterized protein YbjT (DUF2867 family)